MILVVLFSPTWSCSRLSYVLTQNVCLAQGGNLRLQAPWQETPPIVAEADLILRAGANLTIYSALAVNGTGSLLLAADDLGSGAATLTLAKAVTITSPTVTSVTLRGGRFDLGANVDVGSADLVVAPSPSSEAELHLGGAPYAAHLPEAALHQLRTTGRLFLGGAAANKVVIAGLLRYNGTASHVYLQALRSSSSDVAINQPFNISSTTDLIVEANGDVTIAAPVSIHDGKASLTADAQCATVGALLTVTASGSVNTSKSGDIALSSYELAIAGWLDAGSHGISVTTCSGA